VCGALRRNRQKSLAHVDALGDRDESFFLEKPQTPRKRRLVDGKYFASAPMENRLVLRNAH